MRDPSQVPRSSRHQRDDPPAMGALLVLQPVLGHAQSPPTDQQLPTPRTIGVLVPNPQSLPLLLLSSQFDHPLGDVHPRHLRPASGEEPRVVTLSTASVQNRPSAEVTDELKKGGIIEVLAVSIPPFADMIGP